MVRAALTATGPARWRDDQALAAGLEAWLSHHRANDEDLDLVGGAPGAGDTAPPEVTSITHPSNGYSNETVVATLAGARRVVIRLPALHPLFPHYDLRLQAEVHRFAAGHGVPAPAPVHLVDDPSWLGAPFLVMPFVDGHVVSEAPSLDPWLTHQDTRMQAALHDDFIDALAQLHRLDWRPAGAGLVRRLPGATGGLDAELDRWGAYVDWVSDGEPVPAPLTGALECCRARRPVDDPPPSLLWGDVRLGNVVVADVTTARTAAGEIQALLDWEMASVGPAESDLAWYLTLDETVSRLVGRPPGFPGRDATIARYEESLGRSLQDPEWHGCFALTKALAISWRQGRIEAELGGRAVELERHPLVGMLESALEAIRSSGKG